VVEHQQYHRFSGVIHSGRKSQMTFEYTPVDVSLVESFWRFEIPELNVSLPFLLVGTVAEPDVNVDKTHLNFNALLVRSRGTASVSLCMHRFSFIPPS
jgi:hydrocephalus-inducing protein